MYVSEKILVKFGYTVRCRHTFQWRRQDFRKGGALVYSIVLNVRAHSARKIFGDHAH